MTAIAASLSTSPKQTSPTTMLDVMMRHCRAFVVEPEGLEAGLSYWWGAAA